MSATADARTILVVDDARHDYETYVRYLRKAHPERYTTRYISCGREVLPALQMRPHCILLDLSLPDMSGLEVLAKLKETNHGALPYPVVMVTGSGDQHTGQKAVELGAQDYLIKEEVTPESLPRSIEFAIARFSLEQRLRASEERYRQLAVHMKLAADASGIGFWSWNMSTGALSPDENNRRMVGLPLRGPVTYDDFMGMVYEPDRPTLSAAIDKCLRTDTTYDEEFRVLHKDGTLHWISARGSLMTDGDGAPLGLTGMALDVTERKRTREALLESQTRLQMALDAAGLSTWDWELTSDKIVWSPNLEPMLALTAGSFQGHYAAFMELVHPEDRDRVNTAVRQSIEEGSEYRIEFRMLRADGTIRWTETRGTVRRDSAGKPARFVGVDLDITQRKAAEEVLRKIHQDLERHVEVRTAELKQTLLKLENEISVRVEAEQRMRELSSQLLRLQDEERRRIARDLHDTTGQTLTALKLASEGLRLAYQAGRTDLTASFEEVSSLAELALQEIRTTSYLLHPPLLDEAGFGAAARWYVEGLHARSGITVNLQLDASAQRPCIEIETALFRVLQESLTNIVRHSQSRRVDVIQQSADDRITLKIKDYGIGIPEKRLRDFNLTGAGMGVGLAGMRERVRELKGELNIESDGTGTTVTAIVHGYARDAGADSQQNAAMSA